MLSSIFMAVFVFMHVFLRNEIDWTDQCLVFIHWNEVNLVLNDVNCDIWVQKYLTQNVTIYKGEVLIRLVFGPEICTS